MKYTNPDNNDIDRIHSSVKREKADLPAGSEPAPVWIMFVGILAAVIAGTQLIPGAQAFTLDSRGTAMAMQDPRPKSLGAGADLDPFQLAVKKGAGTYGICQGCHMSNGKGMPGQFPPLAGSEWVTGGTERSIRVVLHGLIGPVTAAGQTVNNPAGMLPLGSTLSDTEIANVLTYVRNNFGNTAPMVTKEMVAKVRSETGTRNSQWTAVELETFAAKDVPGVSAAPTK